MTTAEITAYLYGVKVFREQMARESLEVNAPVVAAAWLGEEEFRAIDRLGLRVFNKWMLQGGRDARRG